MNRSRVVRHGALTLLVTLLSSTSAMAQATTRDTMTADTTKKLQTLFTYRDAALAGALIGPTVAPFPADKYIAVHLRDQTTPANRFFDRAATEVEVISSPGAFVIGPYHNKHWASDVVLGAAVGTFSALKVVRYSHAHPDNLIDRVILRTSIAPDGRGGGVVASTIPVS